MNKYFQSAQAFANGNSNDPSRKVGAIIFDLAAKPSYSKRIIYGCNYVPAQFKGDLFCKEYKLARVIHAEMDALTDYAAIQERGVYFEIPTLAVTMPVCDRCAPHIVNAGIKEVYARFDCADFGNARWIDSFIQAAEMFAEAGVKYTLHVGLGSSYDKDNYGNALPRLEALKSSYTIIDQLMKNSKKVQ